MTYSLKDVVKDALSLNLLMLPADAAKARLDMCEACTSIYNPVSKKCGKCGCYMPVKTKLTKATCPLKKW